MSLGGVQDAKWAHEAQVYCGSFCHSQGTVLFLGETALSIWTFVITVYTWLCVARARRFTFQPFVCIGIMGAVWGYVFGFYFGSQSTNPRDDELRGINQRSTKEKDGWEKTAAARQAHKPPVNMHKSMIMPQQSQCGKHPTRCKRTACTSPCSAVVM